VEKIYKDFTQSELDVAYNNVAACPSYESLGRERAGRAAWIDPADWRFQNISYGGGARQTLELILPPLRPQSRLAPLLVFVHGGYWQGGSTAGYRFLAQHWSEAGVAVALIEYTVAPDAAIGQMSAEVRMALDWLSSNAADYGVDGKSICLTGHSAGGHLTVLSMDHASVKCGLAFSGIYELAPVRLTFANRKLQLTEDDVHAYSPARHVVPGIKPLLIAAGANELPEMRRQSEEYALLCRAVQPMTSYMSLAGHDHFSIVEELADPSGILYQAAHRMMKLSSSS
jgi:arylformamidase